MRAQPLMQDLGAADSESNVSTNGSDSSGSTCIVCMDRPREVTLKCGHSNLCRGCMYNLARPFCPTCRAALYGTHQPRQPGGQRSSVPWPFSTSSNPDIAAIRPPLLLLLAERSVPLDLLRARLVALGDRSVSGSLRRSLSLTGSVSSASSHGSASGLQSAYSAPFAQNPNIMSVNGMPVRVVSLGVREQVDKAELLRRVQEMRPDVVVLACVTTQIRTFEALLKWDRALDDRFGTNAPRVWAMLRVCDPFSAVRVHQADIENAIHCLGLGTGRKRLHVNLDLNVKIRVSTDKEMRKLGCYIERFIAPVTAGSENVQAPLGARGQNESANDREFRSSTRARSSSGSAGMAFVERIVRSCLEV